MDEAARAAGLCAALALAAPACYSGSAHAPPKSVAALARDPAWQLVPDVPFVPQRTTATAGRRRWRWCWRISARRRRAADHPELAKGGVRAGELRDAARARGLEAFVVSGTFDDLFDQVGRGRPVLVGLAKPMAFTGGRALAHYEVVVGMNRAKRLILSLDPARGLRENTLEGFAREWAPTQQVTIVFVPRASAAARVPAGAPASGWPRAG